MSGQIIATGRSNTGIPTARLAVWWLIASEIVIFGGLLVAYLLHRLNNPSWGEYAAQTSTVAGAINTFVLLTSSLFIVIAHNAAEIENNTKKAFAFLWGTIGFGGIFMCVKAYEYSSKISHGYLLDTNVFFSFYYTATGLHGLHVVIGMIIMGIISMDVKKGKNLHRIELIGAYWHFVDIVWIFLFPLLYIAK